MSARPGGRDRRAGSKSTTTLRKQSYPRETGHLRPRVKLASTRADTDCNHLAGPRVLHLPSAIVLTTKWRLGADHVLVAWVNRRRPSFHADLRRGTATVARELGSHS